MRIFQFSIIVLLCVELHLSATEPKQALGAEKYFGCYELKVESPNLPSSLEIPKKIKLFIGKAPEGYKWYWVPLTDYIMQPIAEEDGQRGSLTNWRLNTDGDVVITWNNGETGKEIILQPDGKILRGVIYYISDAIDFANPPPRFPLTAAPIKCPY